MSYTPYTTHQMLSVIYHLPQPSTFWLNLAFKQEVNFETQFIDFDVVDRNRRLAPFVAPTAAGKPMKDQGYNTRRFQPAYVKPMIPVDPSRLLTRRPGERYTGSMSPQARRDAIVADILREEKFMITRRWELMAAKAIMDGAITVEGDDYPTQNIAFGRDAGQTVTLTGTDLWTDTTNSTPYEHLEAWSIQTSRLCGYAITDWILGANAWEALRAHPETKDLIATTLRSGGSELQLGPGDIPNDGAIVQLKGRVGAGIRLWTYSDVYEDDTGANVEIMDPNAVIGINPAGVEGVRCYGAILDGAAGYNAMPMFPKNWQENNPSIEYVMTQSAPLMVPRRPNATFKATVV